MITARGNIVTFVLVAALLVLAALSGEPMAERMEHGCTPARTMPPVLSRLRRALVSLMTACRTALVVDIGVAHVLAPAPVAVAEPPMEERPVHQLRI